MKSHLSILYNVYWNYLINYRYKLCPAYYELFQLLHTFELTIGQECHETIKANLLIINKQLRSKILYKVPLKS